MHTYRDSAGESARIWPSNFNQGNHSNLSNQNRLSMIIKVVWRFPTQSLWCTETHAQLNVNCPSLLSDYITKIVLCVLTHSSKLSQYRST